MERRKFLKSSFLAFGSSALVAGLDSCKPSGLTKSNKSTKLVIDYPQKNIPLLELPPCRGEWYEDTIPDTLDIETRSELAINALTGITDPDADYEVYWQTELFRNPPVMMHDHNDWVTSVEGFMEALPLLRAATGSNLNTHVDLAWMQGNLKTVGSDGLVYEILNGTPWSRLNPWSFAIVWKADGKSTSAADESVKLATTPAKCGRVIAAMTVYYLRDRNPIWTQTSERMIQRLLELTVDRGDFAYVPWGAYEPHGKCGPQAKMPTGFDAVDYGNIRMIQGLAQYYRVTGYEPARQLSAKLVAYGMGPAEYYDDQGRFLFSPLEREALMTSTRMKRHYPEAKDAKLGGHFHAHTIGMISILEYAAVAKDQKALNYINSGFQWATTEGSTLVGFFPELAINNRYLTCESCEVADMIGIGVKLSDAGMGDYWDDIDRWVRNQFTEQQLVDGNWFYELAKTQPVKPVAFNETAERLAERNIGAFAGWASANEWATLIGIQQCCLGNSARALYYVLESIVQSQGKQLRVNLLLNRATPWVDVYSYIPYQGRAELKFKKPSEKVLVRAPEWIKSGGDEMVCQVNGTKRNCHWQGRYLDGGHAVPGDKFVVTFPISERTVKETIGDIPYTLTIKGSTVTSIDPPGQIGALYNRAYFRQHEAPFRKVKRFLPEENLVW